MIAAESRGGKKTSLNEALGWIGSRVDDIYGANVGRLDDVWIDPGTGVPRWLLVKEGRFGGRSTLIPFEDATAGAGHVWVPYEREVVRQAPEVEAGASLTQQVEAALRAHYSANSPAAVPHRSQSAPAPADGYGEAPAAVPDAPPAPRYGAPADPYAESRPAPVIRPVPQANPAARSEPPRPAPEPQAPPATYGEPRPAYAPQPEQEYRAPTPPQQQSPPTAAQQPPPQPPAALRGVVAGQVPQAPPQQPDARGEHNVIGIRSVSAEDLGRLTEPGAETYVELEITGEIRIRGDLRNVRIIPRETRGD